MLFVWGVALLFIPLRLWRRLWPAGIMGMVIILLIDGILVSLNAFQFIYNGPKSYGLPVPYVVSYFAGGVLFAWYRPDGRWLRLAYVLAAALLLWVLEFIMLRLGLFDHISWNLAKAYILNICGFIIFFWMVEWAGFARKADASFQKC